MVTKVFADQLRGYWSNGHHMIAEKMTINITAISQIHEKRGKKEGLWTDISFSSEINKESHEFEACLKDLGHNLVIGTYKTRFELKKTKNNVNYYKVIFEKA